MNKFYVKFGNLIAVLALVLTTMNVNSTCKFAAHQPKMPENFKKLRKF